MKGTAFIALGNKRRFSEVKTNHGLKCPYKGLHYWIDHGIFAAPIPMALLCLVDDQVVGHSEIRDLGTTPKGIRVAGLSNTVVSEGFRGQFMYQVFESVRQARFMRSDFDCVAGRVDKKFVAARLRWSPQFFVVKNEDRYGAAWVLKVLPHGFLSRKSVGLTVDEVVRFLERKVKKW